MNSNEPQNPVIDTASKPPLQIAALPLEQSQQNQQLQQLLQNEAPLLSLPPGVSLLSPSKPLVEMTQDELSAWHSKLRDHRNYQTMQSHIASVAITTTKKTSKPKQDISEFI